ncbi:MAG TPA: hypothetical protein DCP69_08080 [Candidatus Omnitrophica bacterium]|nr:hypothetical protein [Candidatus Omnitrophota bacterium]
MVIVSDMYSVLTEMLFTSLKLKEFGTVSGPAVVVVVVPGAAVVVVVVGTAVVVPGAAVVVVATSRSIRITMLYPAAKKAFSSAWL